MSEMIDKRKRTVVEAPSEKIFRLQPEQLTLVRDEGHRLYDPRVEIPPNPARALLMLRHGCLDTVLATRVGDESLVVNGRRRVIDGCYANAELWKSLPEQAKAGLTYPVVLRVRFVKLPPETPEGDKELLGLMLAANFHLSDDPVIEAKKIQRALDTGMSLKEAADYFDCSVGTLVNRQAVLKCLPEVQGAVSKGVVPNRAIREFAGLSGASQLELLTKFKSGELRGDAALDAIRIAKGAEETKEETVERKTRAEKRSRKPKAPPPSPMVKERPKPRGGIQHKRTTSVRLTPAQACCWSDRLRGRNNAQSQLAADVLDVVLGRGGEVEARLPSCVLEPLEEARQKGKGYRTRDEED